MAIPPEQNEEEEQNSTDDDYLDNDDDDEDEEEDDENEEEDDDDYYDVDEEQESETEESRFHSQRNKLNNLLRRLSKEHVIIRVYDVLIKGNTITETSLIESEIKALKNATTMQELLIAANLANARLKKFEIFDSVSITLDTGPPELPGTTNVIVEVVETKNPLTGDIVFFSNPEARLWSLEGSGKLKNLLGYGDIWNGSWAYGWDQTAEISSGVSFPRVIGLRTPFTARMSLLSQDWMNLSSYKQQLLGLSFGLVSTRHHDLSYNFTWHSLADPSQRTSKTIRSQFGHSLLTSLKHTFKIDQRDSSVRPTEGYAFVVTSQVGGLSPENPSLRFVRQEFDGRFALPLGFCNAALNFGASAGVIFPLGSGSMNMTTPLPERYYLGGNSSPVCKLGGPTLMGFRSRGLGPTEPRRATTDKPNNESSANCPARDSIGGDLAVTAFADLSFDLPWRVLREAGIHGHLFASAGKLSKLTEGNFRNFSYPKFKESIRSSAGAGIVVPTKLFRMEVNYCYILKQLEHDRGKTGIQLSFSSPL